MNRDNSDANDGGNKRHQITARSERALTIVEAQLRQTELEQHFGNAVYTIAMPERTITTHDTDHTLSDLLGGSNQSRKLTSSRVVLGTTSHPLSLINRQQLVAVTDVRNHIRLHIGRDYRGRITHIPLENILYATIDVLMDNNKRRTLTKTFCITKYGHETTARIAVSVWLHTISDRLRYTRTVVVPTRHLGIIVSEHDRIFLAWFIGGDGHFGMTSRSYIEVIIAQSCFDGLPPVMMWILQHIAGQLHEKHTPANDAHRRMYHLLICDPHEIRFVAECVAQFGILKRDQAQAILDYYVKDDNGETTPADIASLRDFLVHAHQVENLQQIEVAQYALRFNDIATAGIFQAEGTVWIEHGHDGRSGRVRLTICQLSCIPFLRTMLAFWNGDGGIFDGAVRFNIPTQKRLMHAILPHLLEPKKGQVELAIRFQELCDAGLVRRPTEEATLEIEFIRYFISSLKHEDRGYK